MREHEAEAIKAAHPTRTGRHDLYAEAMRLVGERHAKAELVELVNWCLYECAKRSDQQERAKIVAYLRTVYAQNRNAQDFADIIEAGEHDR